MSYATARMFCAPDAPGAVARGCVHSYETTPCRESNSRQGVAGFQLDFMKKGGEVRLLLRRRLLGRCAREYGVVAAGARHQNRQRDGDHHEENGSPCGELGQQVGCAAWAKGRLRTLTAKCSRQIGGLALLQKHYADQKQADDDVNHNQKIDHRDSKNLELLRYGDN